MNYQQMPISNLWRNKNDESKQFVCKDCGNKNYQLFMANDNLWQKYGTGNNTLCQKCFEKKLGRKMTQKDTEQYKHSPINSHIVNFKEWLLNESKFPVLPNKIGKHNEYELQNFEPKLEEIIEKIKQKLNQEPTSTSELIYQFDTYELSNRKKYILKPIARIFLTKEIPGEAQGGFEEDRNIVWVSRIIKPYQIKKVLLHELGHLFDPKMRVPEYMEKSRLKQQTNPESQFYKTALTEFDANSAALQFFIKEKIVNSEDKNQIINNLEEIIRKGTNIEDLTNFLDLPKELIVFIDEIKIKPSLHKRFISRMDNLLQSLKRQWKK